MKKFKILKNLSIKGKILLIISASIVLTALCYTALNIYVTEKTERKELDNLLYSVAYGAHNIIGDNYHEIIEDSSSISQADYEKSVNALTKFANETKVREIYSYINYCGELRYTSGSLRIDDIISAEQYTFFTKYEDAPQIVQDIYFKPFRDKKSMVYSYEDISGSVRSVFIPFTTSNGKNYIIAVDYSTDEIDKMISSTTFLFIGIGLLLLLIIIISAYIPINQISKPLRGLVKYTNELVNNDFHLPEKSLQNLYNFSSETNNEIGQLSEAFLAMQFSLSQYIIDLRDTTVAKENIEAQLKIASSIQIGMIPKEYPSFPNNPEFNIGGYMSPAKEVGGDLFNYFMIDDEHLGFVIGDVSDKGIPAALFMVMTNTLIKVIAMNGLSPAEVLFYVNNELCRDNDQCMFVTLMFGKLNIKTGVVQYANAGHNPFIVVQNNNVVEYRKLEPGIVLAAFNDVKFVNEHFTLNPNETIFMYTDGVTEAMNHNRNLFGEERLLALIKEIGTLEIPNLIDETVEGIARFVKGNEQSDDITILALRFISQDKIE